MTKPQRPTAVRSLAKFSFLVLILVAAYCYYLTLPASIDISPRNFEITKGESVKSIATRLQSKGLIRSPLFFRLIVRQNKLTLQAGIYELSPSLAPNVLAQTLTRGLAIDKKITIPEGYRLEQIAETSGIPIKDFMTAAAGLEGQLFPDTYFVKEGITAPELVKIMHDNFVKKIGTIDKTTLILASLVERETKGDAEKPIVAGILKKRLAAGWPLELDATVQYFLGKKAAWWPNTTLLDRKLKSPYNTYLNRGLPPGPICNPGLSSIRAAQNPKDSPYWFYLHDKNGTIHYGATLSEHNANIAKYIK
ncbi:MAG: endolytic transglycosylase MltG [Microgenomates group bacterium]